MWRRSLSYSYIVAVLLSVMAGCTRSGGGYRVLEGVVWHTTYRIVYQGDGALGDSVQRVFSEVENSLSPFLPSSTISRINTGIDSVADVNIARVMAASKQVNTLSGGAFDPTVSPLVNLWGFGFEGHPGHAPSQAEIDSVMSFIGISGVAVDKDLNVHKPDVRMQFNFSAITKGYGCDLVADMLRRNGVDNYMVEIGGEIVASGMNPRGKPWRIQIDAPRSEDPAAHERMRMLTLDGCAVATSGNYRNYRQIDGYGRAWHTISPATGYPVETSTLSASVIAPQCMLADAFATAVMAMPADSAFAMIESVEGVEALIVVADSEGGFSLMSTSGFPAE